MKRFLTGIFIMLLGASITMAQAPAASKPKTKTEKTTASTAPLKKDGTPDKRFKANKTTATEGPKKKDGSLDMRYKANKDAAKKKS